MRSRSVSMPCAGHGADKGAPLPRRGWAGIDREQVDLVEDGDARLVSCAELVEHLLHGGLLAEEVRIGGVDDLEQQVGAHHLLEGGSEGIDEVVRELVDESHGIGDDHRATRGQGHLAARRIQRGEQHVRRVQVGIGERVEKRALAGIGVADQRHARDLVAIPVARRRGAMALHIREIALDLLDPLADEASVSLELALARAAGPDSAAGA